MLPANVSLLLLNFLQNLGNDTNNCTSETSHVRLLNEIIGIANNERIVETIVYFGRNDEIEPFITVMPEIPKVLITNSVNRWNFNEAATMNTNIFFLAVSRYRMGAKWQDLYETFAFIQRHVRGAFLVSTTMGLLDHFDWCWKKGFVNTIAIVCRDKKCCNHKVYTYLPFPSVNFREVKSEELSINTALFSRRMTNFQGYKVRTAAQFDPPRVFRVPASPNNWTNPTYGGYAGIMYRAFLGTYNGTLNVVLTHNGSQYNILDAIEQINRGDIDLSMNPYFVYPGVRTSYPLYMMRWCVLVPAKGEIEKYIYFLRPFQWKTWIGCIVWLFFLSFLSGLYDFIEGKILWPVQGIQLDFGKAFLYILRMMLCLPTPSANPQIHWHHSFYIILVTAFGFVLSNFYLTLLTSFLSKVIFQPQVDTMQDMVDANLSIYAIPHEIPIILKNRGLPKRFADLLVPRNNSDIVRDILDLKLGHAYLAREDMIFFVMEQQKNLLYQKFHTARECITTIPVGFLMPSHSQFKTVLDNFILRSSAHGLIPLWYKAATTDGIKAGLLQHETEDVDLTPPLSLAHLQFACLILTVGFALAFVSFAFEQSTRFKLKITFELKK